MSLLTVGDQLDLWLNGKIENPLSNKLIGGDDIPDNKGVPSLPLGINSVALKPRNWREASKSAREKEITSARSVNNEAPKALVEALPSDTTPSVDSSVEDLGSRKHKPKLASLLSLVANNPKEMLIEEVPNAEVVEKKAPVEPILSGLGLKRLNSIVANNREIDENFEMEEKRIGDNLKAMMNGSGQPYTFLSQDKNTDVTNDPGKRLDAALNNPVVKEQKNRRNSKQTARESLECEEDDKLSVDLSQRVMKNKKKLVNDNHDQYEEAGLSARKYSSNPYPMQGFLGYPPQQYPNPYANPFPQPQQFPYVPQPYLPMNNYGHAAPFQPINPMAAPYAPHMQFGGYEPSAPQIQPQINNAPDPQYMMSPNRQRNLDILDVSPEQDRQSRPTRLQMKHQTELQTLQFEIEMLQKRHELEEIKENFDRQKIIREQDHKHELWLLDQQNELQAIRMKQAIVKEQKLLNLQLKDSGITLDKDGSVIEKKNTSVSQKMSGGGGSGDGSVDMMRMIAGVSSLTNSSDGNGNGIPLESVRNVNVLVDGILLPKSLLYEQLDVPSKEDNSFRVALAIYDDSGKSIARLSASEWQSAVPFGSGDVFLLDVTVKKSLKKKDLISGLTRNSKALAEIQAKSSNGNIVGVGWAVIPLLLVDASGDMSPAALATGFWRGVVRKDIADGSKDPHVINSLDILQNDSGQGWVLFRVSGDTSKGNEENSNSNLSSSWNVRNSIGCFSNANSFLSIYIDPLSQFPVTVVPDSLAASASSRNLMGTPSRGITSSKSQRGISSAMSKLQRAGNLVKAADKLIPSSSNGSMRSGQAPPTPIKEEDDEEENESEDGDNEEAERESAKLIKNKGSKVWKAGTPTDIAREKYVRGDGVDIYIDGAMFLPDNCAASRCVVKIFSIDNEMQGDPYECYADPFSSAMSPMFNFKIELRSESVINVTSTALVRLDAIDCVTLQTFSVGYACFKIFCTQDRNQPKQVTVPNICINTGLFQLPIKSEKLKPPDDGFTDKLLDKYPSVPCATLLVRIYPAPKSSGGLSTLSRDDFPKEEWEKKGLNILAPSYNSGLYDGSLCEPTVNDEIGFAEKLQNASQTVDSLVSNAMSSSVNTKTDQLPQRPKADTEVARWIESLFAPSTNVRDLLNYSYLSPYSIDSGLSVCIDGCIHLPDISGFFSSSTNVYKVIYSIIPPSIFYMDPPLTNENVQFTRENSLEGSVRCPRFNDGFFLFNPPLMAKPNSSESLWLVIDVRTIKVDPPKKVGEDPIVTVEPKGVKKSFWTILPLFKERLPGQGFKYVASGVYLLPLIEGSVPADLLQNSSDPFRDVLGKLSNTMTSGSTKNGLSDVYKLNSDGACVLVRVANPQLSQIVTDVTSKEPSVYEGLIDRSVHAKYLSAAGMSGKSSLYSWDPSKYATAKKLNEIFKNLDPKAVLKSVNKAFILALATHFLKVEMETLVDVEKLIPSVFVDMKYATEDNFMHMKVYPSSKCFLRAEVAQKLKIVQDYLVTLNLSLKIWDAYRPLSVQRILWDLTPDKRFVADPAVGSNHNRAAAVDLTLVTLDGTELEMPTPFDDFSLKAHSLATEGISEIALKNRETLRNCMESNGFSQLPHEWWHFNDSHCKDYPVLDINFDELP